MARQTKITSINSESKRKVFTISKAHDINILQNIRWNQQISAVCRTNKTEREREKK